MARYTITYACGHRAEKQLYGKTGDRERYMAWATASGKCAACAASDTHAAQDGTEAALCLPVLSGSDKQIAWARKLRVEKFTEIETFIQGLRKQIPEAKILEFEGAQDAIMAILTGKADAKYWIESRDINAQRIVQSAIKEISNEICR